MIRSQVWRCSSCGVEYGIDPPQACNRCAGLLYRLPMSWHGREVTNRARNPRIMSAQSLRGQKFSRRSAGEVFGNLFKRFIPASFFMVLTGLPSYGKSTLLLKMLEDGTFKRPLLAAVEEGLSLSLADRLSRAEAVKTTVCDAKSLPELVNVIDEFGPDCLAVDSVTAAGVKEGEVLTLRRHYPNLSFICVVQSTKDGSHKGSQGWLHDCDVVVTMPERMHWKITKSWFSELKEGKV